MKIVKKYTNEGVKNIRNDIIDILGLGRDVLRSLEKKLSSPSEIEFANLKKNNESIGVALFNFDLECVKILSDKKLDDNDVRLVIGGNRLVINIEKMVTKILKLLTEYKNVANPSYIDKILKITDMVIASYDKLVIGFIYNEIQECYKIIADDISIDKLRDTYTSEILQSIMKNNDFISDGIVLINIMNYIERIGDYLVYIAESIIYVSSGEDVRYKETTK